MFALEFSSILGSHQGFQTEAKGFVQTMMEFLYFLTLQERWVYLFSANHISKSYSRVKTLDEGSMQCIDHKLNSALQKSSEANEILYEAFTRARNLAIRAHQSGYSMTELEEACLRLKTECLKLPLICPTKWNCHHKMITALQRMKEPLLYLKRHNSDFEKLVATKDEFEYFKSLSNMLKQVKDCSDFLSSEKSVRLDNALYHVKLLVQGCKNMVHSYPVETYPVIGSFCKTLLSELDKRFPMEGAVIYPLAVGNILHPTWKENLLPDAATTHEVINRLINEIEENHMEEDVSATSQNLLRESLTPGTIRKRHPTPMTENVIQVTFSAICLKNFKEWLKQNNSNVSKTRSGLSDVSLIYIWMTKIFVVFNTVALSGGKKMPTNFH